ncbi:nucleotidyltransferase family protein [Paraglaciecola arctica]|uniref:nucleotidyltransferase family protein n=1 Tax=Paraglaciecola arctica TaxID=1128911 RepID=UPI001C07D93D|nr:nucleotidyltransferase family protein [Paraglaciecola arctica]MBU3004490.1 nucleotidyltransferase family protein [Paraglaciecola arctica]
MTSSHKQHLIRLLEDDPDRMAVLKAVATLTLPDCWVAAGFVRNLVWDHLHQKKTELNDVDVIYYSQPDPESDTLCETRSHLGDIATQQLKSLLPQVNWQVKNQALMHKKHLHSRYLNSTDAMTFWPEQETAIAVKIDPRGGIAINAPFGLSSLFAQQITFNPKADERVFRNRIAEKSWLTTWPKLQLVSLD